VKHDTLLIFVKGDVVIVHNVLAGFRVRIEQAFYRFPLQESRLDDFFNILRLNFLVE
jgi:hypothetical protein